jgi:hypothetical protein
MIFRNARGIRRPPGPEENDPVYIIHYRFAEFLDDLGIFIYQVRPLLKERAGAIEGGALPKSRTYVIPSGEARISIFHRSNQEIADGALRTAWITVLLSALATEAIGLAAATWPAAWIGSFSADPAVLAIGTTYLRIVGPFFGFFGMGYALYCAGQGTGRMGWPVAGAVTRATIAVVGGAHAIRLGTSLDHIFMAVSLGMMSFGLLSLPSLFNRSAYGTRQRNSAARGPTAFYTRVASS